MGIFVKFEEMDKKSGFLWQASAVFFGLWPHVVDPVERLDLFTVDPDFPMEVSATGTAGVTDETDGLVGLDGVANADIKFGLVTVDSVDAPTVIDDGGVAVDIKKTLINNCAGCGG
jgi:hypothetical protein